MENPFGKFEKFGAVCDFETRKRIAQTIFNKLLTGTDVLDNNADDFFNADDETENFSAALEIIFSNETLRQMTKNNPALAEATTQEILNFIHQTKRAITAFGNPYQGEVMLADSFSIIEPKDHKTYWKIVRDFLKETYDKNAINPDFYARAFNKTFKPDDDKKENQTYESIRDHLTEKWRELILLKVVEFQQLKMEEFRAEFTKQLFEMMEEYKHQSIIMQSFATDFSQIFDYPEKGMSRENLDTLKKYHEMLEMNHSVKELVEMLGRMKLTEEEQNEGTFGTSDNKFEWEANHASKTDLIGVIESDDLNNLLPSETVLLSDPVLQTLFFKKFAEKKLQTFEFEDKIKSFRTDESKKGTKKGKESEKGPFIICVDTSGSMQGLPETIAKTICLAILKIALKENRNCYLISFSVGIVTLDMTDLKNNMEKIIDFLAMSFHGGTDASPALAEAVTMLETQSFSNADVLMISDFQMPEIQDAILARIKTAREKKTKFHSLIIGDYGYWHGYRNANEEVINEFDHTWHYNSREKNGIFQLVKNLKEL